jgi:DNA-binding MarR family transcriptional regulator
MATGSTGPRPGAAKTNRQTQQDAARRFAWEIASIDVYLQEIRSYWARILGVTGPQWMILMAIKDLDHGEGASVKVVSARLHVDPSFVTTNSKMLEKKGFLRRKTSREDARVVLMSLTDKTSKHVAALETRQDELNEFIFDGLSDHELEAMVSRLATLKSRLEKARLRAASEL